IDDFGTGYTSLSALRALPINELKIDQSFVRRSVTSPRDLAVVRSVTELAHRLGMTVVAEGVENEAIEQQMIECEIDRLQGYRFSKPLAENDLLLHLRAELPLHATGPLEA